MGAEEIQGRPGQAARHGERMPRRPSTGIRLSLWTYDEALHDTLNRAVRAERNRHASWWLGDAKVTVTSSNAAAAGQTLQAPATIVFEYSDDSGLTVRKTFHFDHSYVVKRGDFGFSNGHSGLRISGMALRLRRPGHDRRHTPQANSNISSTATSEHLNVKKIPGGNTRHGFLQLDRRKRIQYFGAIFIPDNPDNLIAVTLQQSRRSRSGSQQARKPKPSPQRSWGSQSAGRANPRERLFVGPKSLAAPESVSVPTIIGADKDLRGAGELRLARH